MSDVIGVSAGIAQGTVLGPLIFIFYINDVIHSITQCRISMFADDCIIYTVANDFEPMHRKLQSDLDSFIMWCSHNGLNINISKTKAMITTTNGRLRTLQNVYKFQIGDQHIQYVNQYNYLGLLSDNELTLIPLLKHVKKIVNNKLFALRKLRKYLTNQAAFLVYKQTIMPIFDYAGFMLISLNNSDKYDLQVIQNDALRFCKNIRMLDKVSIPKIHDSISLLSLEQRQQKQLMNIMHGQALKGNERVVTNVNTRRQVKYVCKTETKMGRKYQHSPFFLGTQLWDSLDKETRDLPCRYAFKRKISMLYKKYNPLL